MTLEAVLAALLLGAALSVLTIGRVEKWRRAGIAALAAATALAAWLTLAPERRAVSEHEVSTRPAAVAGEQYVTSTTCRACHPREYATWAGSYHRSMTQVATPRAVRGEFPGRFTMPEGEYELTRRGDEFWVEMPDPRAPAAPGAGPRPRVERQLVMTTGSHHLQFYWYASGTRRQPVMLPVAFRIAEKRWLPRDAVLLMPPEVGQIHNVGQWSKACIKCHATHGQPRLDLAAYQQTGRWDLDTRVAEFGIACESCHGPAETHVKANRDPRRRYAHHARDAADDTIVNPERLAHGDASRVCGQCHGVWVFGDNQSLAQWWWSGFRYRPGEDPGGEQLLVRYNENLHHPHIQDLLRGHPAAMEDTFWSDGAVRINGREYNDLLDTPCFQRGEMSCLSCHALHKATGDARPARDWTDDQLKPGMRGNEACLQCHEGFRTNVEAHTHHAEDSRGSACYDCHMANTVYGLLKATRSHRLDSPDTATSVRTGRPNACNLCHLDQTLAWTAGHLESWYGIPAPDLDDDERSIASSVLLALKGDAGVRALVAWSMGWAPALEASGSDWEAPLLLELLDDPYAALRFIAHRSLRALPGFENFEFDYVAPPEQRLASIRAAWQLWDRSNGATDRANRAPLLLDRRGTLEHETVARLLTQRDTRPIVLQE
jgi:hypothetical protein